MDKIILCIGTSKCIGDSLGPIVGEYLYNNIKKSNVYVLGNLKNNITYQNIDVILNRINNTIKNPYMILIDSALSNKNYIGKIVVNKNKMIVGSALNKSEYKYGNLSIKGIVGENKYSYEENYNELNNVSLDLVKNISKNIINDIIPRLECLKY